MKPEFFAHGPCPSCGENAQLGPGECPHCGFPIAAPSPKTLAAIRKVVDAATSDSLQQEKNDG